MRGMCTVLVLEALRNSDKVSLLDVSRRVAENEVP
jgi:hypothetical protein